MKTHALFLAASAAALLAAAPPALAWSQQQSQATPSQKQFLTKAIQGDNSEIELGRLAQRQARSDQVRQFANTLVDDHTKARDEATKVAQNLGVTPPDGVMPDAAQESAKLRNMSGIGFDREFVSYMVKDHKKDIADFKKEANDHHGPVGQLAQKQLPTLEKHLKIAESLSDQRISRR